MANEPKSISTRSMISLHRSCWHMACCPIAHACRPAQPVLDPHRRSIPADDTVHETHATYSQKWASAETRPSPPPAVSTKLLHPQTNLTDLEANRLQSGMLSTARARARGDAQLRSKDILRCRSSVPIQRGGREWCGSRERWCRAIPIAARSAIGTRLAQILE